MAFSFLRIAFAAALLFCTAAASAQVSLYVDSSQTVSGAGTSWATAYKTLNEALNVANNASAFTGYNVHVAKGTYYPTGAQAGTARDSSFTLRRGGLRVYGGYPSGGGARAAGANPTVLSGAIGNAADSNDNSYTVVVAVNVPAAGDSTILDGFRVERGSSAGPGGFKWYNGTTVFLTAAAAAFIRATSPKLLFKDCGFSHCYGRALYVMDANLKLQGCTLNGNRADYAGGAIYNDNRNGGVLRLDSCALTGNRAYKAGGAIWTSKPMQSLQVSNSSFSNNIAHNQFLHFWGGAIYYDSATLTGDYLLRNVHFSGNVGSAGGAVYLNDWTGTAPLHQVRFSHCSFTNNLGEYSNDDGGAVGFRGEFNARFDTCIFSGNVSNSNGGAIFINTGRLGLYGCTFQNDSAYYSGGVLYSPAWLRLTAESTSFMGNHGIWGDGGAVYFPGDSAQFHNCTFESNGTRHGSGGAIASPALYLTMDGCRVRGNFAGVHGGGLFLDGFFFTLRNTLISGNRASSTGGGLKCNAITLTMEGVTMAGDSAATLRGMSASASASIKNCIFWEGFGGITLGIPTLTYSTVQGGYAGTGNLGSNPLFVAPVSHTLAPTTAGNYSLTACSPSINAGLNSGTYAGVTDAAGAPRLTGSTIDHGAFEFQSATAAGTLTGISSGTLCTGSSGQLSASMSGGTWSNPAPALVTVSSTGLVTAGGIAGTDTVMYSIAGSCPAQSMRIITVAAAPAVAAISGPASACAGASVQLTNTTAGGVWSSSAPSIASVTPGGLVNGLAPVTAIIKYKVTNTAGCADSVSSTITVLLPPTVAPITGPAPGVCVGGTLQLASATTGGAWSNWCSTGALTVSGSGLVSGAAPGACSVSYTVSAANGCSTAAAYPVMVYPQAAAPVISGPATVCIGTPATYAATPAGGAWNTLGSISATITVSGVLSGATAGSAAVLYSYTNVNGCEGSGSFPITINAPATSNAAGTLCGGSGVYIFGGQVLAMAGTYKDTLSTAAGCDSVVTLTLTSSGATSPDTSIAQTGTMLSANATGAGTSYQWVRCEANGTKTILAGATAQTFSPSVAGSYAVIVTTGGCAAMSGCRSSSPAGTGVDEWAAAGWEVFPNPATDRVMVRCGAIVPRSIILLDATGKRLAEVQPSSASTEVSLAGRGGGLYLIRVCDAAGQCVVFPVSVVR